MSFTRTQIKELADKRTERRGGKLDLDSEILLAIQDICQDRKWWWRRKTVRFETAATTSEYDLSDTVLQAGDFQQFMKDGVKLFTAPDSFGIVEPLFDIDKQDTALEMASTQSGTPCQYFMKPGEYLTLVLTPTPNGIWPVRASYWAVPDSTPDAQEEQIPLIPTWLHPALLSRLEARINKFTLGEGAALYTSSMTEYAGQLAKAGVYEDFAEGKSRQSLAGAHGDAIQST